MKICHVKTCCMPQQIFSYSFTTPFNYRYSLKFSWVKNFEDFEDFCLALKILSLKFLGAPIKNLVKTRKFYHENFFKKNNH